METYTHNLKILLFDNDNNIICDNDFLEKIKTELCELNTKNIKWNTENIKVSIKWYKKELNNIDKQFMGDLFSKPIYDYDSIIIKHTEKIISNINNPFNYNIKFYISRLVGDKTTCEYSYGLV